MSPHEIDALIRKGRFIESVYYFDPAEWAIIKREWPHAVTVYVPGTNGTIHPMAVLEPYMRVPEGL